MASVSPAPAPLGPPMDLESPQAPPDADTPQPADTPEHSSLAPRLKIYSYNNYKISKKTARVRITHPTFEAKMKQLQEFVETKHVNRSSVYGVIIVHQNNQPHLVVLNTSQNAGQTETIELFVVSFPSIFSGGLCSFFLVEWNSFFDSTLNFFTIVRIVPFSISF